MGIEFSKQRWNQVIRDAELWWAGGLGRPLIQLRLDGRDPGRPEPGLAPTWFTAHYGLDTPVDQILDRAEYDLSKERYLGDAFPCWFPNFGPGVVAAFLGAQLSCGPDTVWFHPKEVLEPGQLRLDYRADNPWYQRVREIFAASARRWDGLVQTSMTDLGGTLDILASFRPSELLPMDLYESPEEVRRLTWDIHRHWLRYYEELDSLIRPTNPGYTSWTPVFSSSSSYMLQCDFCFMIGPAQFREFAYPELADSFKRFKSPFYHLDGVGELNHLDALLADPNLKGIQWIPGASQPGVARWPEVYKKILKAGKRIQLFGSLEEFDEIARQIGVMENFVFIATEPIEREKECVRILEKYGAARPD